MFDSQTTDTSVMFYIVPLRRKTLLWAENRWVLKLAQNVEIEGEERRSVAIFH